MAELFKTNLNSTFGVGSDLAEIPYYIFYDKNLENSLRHNNFKDFLDLSNEDVKNITNIFKGAYTFTFSNAKYKTWRKYTQHF